VIGGTYLNRRETKYGAKIAADAVFPNMKTGSKLNFRTLEKRQKPA